MSESSKRLQVLLQRASPIFIGLRYHLERWTSTLCLSLGGRLVRVVFSTMRTFDQFYTHVLLEPPPLRVDFAAANKPMMAWAE
ncbi:unnamed protein product [Amoebophrya sp. A120]|nr:unnamed protein product [Amoebophrya sp. A120]|eukprot:GSA120T00024148001.1